MGSLGVQEMIVIFLLALLLFGPKKLPEIGRTIGKAITEFRRASSELKETFSKEVQNLEREADSIKEATSPYQYDTYNYDYSSNDPQKDGSYSSESDYAATPSLESASAPQGAELPPDGAPEGAIAQGSEATAEPEIAVSEEAEAPAPVADEAAPITPAENKA